MWLKPWQMTRNPGRLAFRFALVSCYLLSVLGGSLHYVLYHVAPHGESACASEALPALHSDCESDEHGASSKACQVCISLARSLGVNTEFVTVTALASSVTPNLPPASPAITMPYRPHVQRGPPVHV